MADEQTEAKAASAAAAQKLLRLKSQTNDKATIGAAEKEFYAASDREQKANSAAVAAQIAAKNKSGTGYGR